MNRVAEVAVAGRLPLPAGTVRRVVSAVLAGEHSAARVSITFLGPARMGALNHQYTGHDGPTDVLSFALPQPDGTLAGDVYVCRAVAARQALRHEVSLREELIRLVVHGTLHLLGYDHPEGSDRERSAMWRRQERYVRALG